MSHLLCSTPLILSEVASNPRAVAGFSVGEIAALVAAGVMSYEQGLIIVKAGAFAELSKINIEL